MPLDIGKCGVAVLMHACNLKVLNIMVWHLLVCCMLAADLVELLKDVSCLEVRLRNIG
jgi:hypothetical protein